jgi:hypothetical protein
MLGIMFKDVFKELKVVFGYFLVFVGIISIAENGGVDHYLLEDYIFDSYWWETSGIYIIVITATYLGISMIWKVIRGFVYSEIFNMMNKLEEKKGSKV